MSLYIHAQGLGVFWSWSGDRGSAGGPECLVLIIIKEVELSHRIGALGNRKKGLGDKPSAQGLPATAFTGIIAVIEISKPSATHKSELLLPASSSSSSSTSSSARHHLQQHQQQRQHQPLQHRHHDLQDDHHRLLLHHEHQQHFFPGC